MYEVQRGLKLPRSYRGNTAYHLKTLEQAGIICSSKVVRRNRNYMVYEMTAEGKRKFREFLEILKRVIDS